MTWYENVLNHLFRCFAIDALIGKADAEIYYFKQGSLRPADLP